MSKYLNERLKEGGIDAKRISSAKVAVNDITFAPEGHALHHPREEVGPDPALVESILTEGFREEQPIVVWEEVTSRGKALYVIDGSRRRAAAAAQAHMHSSGALPAGESFYVPIQLHVGTLAEALVVRVRANSDPLKKPDTPSVLSKTFLQMKKVGLTVEDMVRAHGRLSAREVEDLLRFQTLPTQTREAFDAGLPPALIPSFLDAVPADKHAAAIEAALEHPGKPRAAKAAAEAVARAAAEASGNGKARPRPLSASMRAKVLAALADVKWDGEREADVVRAMVAYEALVLGDAQALSDNFPSIAGVALRALDSKQKEKEAR